MTIETNELDALETSAPKKPTDNYRTYITAMVGAEYDATESVYRAWDLLDKKTRCASLLDCRTRAWFVRNLETGHVRVGSNSCRLRWCPMCSKAKAAYISDVVTDWIHDIKSPKFLTLTLKHSDSPLEHQVTSLYKFFKKWRERRDVRKILHGAIWFFQVVRSPKSDQWHPHLHMVVDSGWFPRDLISDTWLAVTGNSKIVNIKVIRDEKKVAAYVARYCSRPCNLENLSDGDRIEIVLAMHGRRLCGSFGTAKSLKLRQPDKPDIKKWQKIGNWSTVVNLKDMNKFAKMIWECWIEGDPIPPGIDLNAFDAFIDDPFRYDDCTWNLMIHPGET